MIGQGVRLDGPRRTVDGDGDLRAELLIVEGVRTQVVRVVSGSAAGDHHHACCNQQHADALPSDLDPRHVAKDYRATLEAAVNEARQMSHKLR